MDGVTLALLLGGTALAGYVLYSGATQPTTGETDYINGVNNQFDALINSFNPTVPAIGNTTIAPPDFASQLGDAFSSIGNFFSGAVTDLGAAGGAALSTNYTGVDMNSIIAGAEGILQGREGRRNDVYLDSVGVLTTGIGHRVVSADGLSLGDTISDAQVDQFFANDAQAAYNAANGQAVTLGKSSDANFLIALLCVNFQLGAGWTTKFPNTWNYIKSGNIQQAINNLYQSAWYQQTPDRVNDFVAALQTSYGVA